MAKRIVDSKNRLTTKDGVDANDLWQDFQAALEDYNETSNGLVASLTFQTTESSFLVIQGAFDFEEYADFTLPDAQDVTQVEIVVGMKDFDMRNSYTWAAILRTPQSELDAKHSLSLQGDQRNIIKQVIRAALTKEGLTLGGTTGKPFWNADGIAPSPYKNQTFTGSHSHYLVSGAATVAAIDLERMEDDLVHHGFEGRLVLLANREQIKTIKTFTGFTPNSQDNRDADYTNLVDAPFVGSFGKFDILEESWIPAKYMFGYAAQGGDNSPQNPIALRIPENTNAQGLILKRGTDPDYPLVDSFYYREFGAGVRQRSNGVVMQITTNGTYTTPTI